MLRKFWTHLVTIPDGLDWADRLYVRGLYIICALFALVGPLFLLAALTGQQELKQRLILVGASVLTVALAYVLRLFIYWFTVLKLRLLRLLHLQ